MKLEDLIKQANQRISTTGKPYVIWISGRATREQQIINTLKDKHKFTVRVKRKKLRTQLTLTRTKTE